MTRAKLLNRYKDSPILMERSVFSDRHTFAKTCFEKGSLNSIEWNTYIEWFDWLSKEFNLEEDAYIYLRTDPKISYKRIQKRARKEEKQISYEYVLEIHNKHEDWLSTKQNVLILDGNIENSNDRMIEFSTKIFDFISKYIKNTLYKNKFEKLVDIISSQKS